MVARKLDEVVRERLRSNPSDRKVVLTSLMDLNGTVSVKEDNVLILSLVNMQQDSVAGGTNHRYSTPQVSVAQSPPIYLNLYLLLGVYFKAEQVRDGMDTLSIAIAYLQGKPLWNVQNTPDLSNGVERLIFEMESLDFHQQSHLWGSIGAKYIPSVVYKMRMMIIDDGAIDQIIPVVKETGGSGLKSN
jgi:hypothetical protein